MEALEEGTEVVAAVSKCRDLVEPPVVVVERQWDVGQSLQDVQLMLTGVLIVVNWAATHPFPVVVVLNLIVI